MSKQIKKVTIIDSKTLRLDEDAQPGDIINLADLDVKMVDSTLITKKIEEARDTIYLERLNDAKKHIYLEMENNNIASLKDKEVQIELLKKDIINLKQSLTSELELRHQKQIDDLCRQLDMKDGKHQLELSERTKALSEEIVVLRTELHELRKSSESNIQREVQKVQIIDLNVINEKQDRIVELERRVSQLTHGRTSKNTKRLGEDLEVWCNSEYSSYSSAFANCVWIRDTIAVKDDGDVKGTKADYLFEIYSDDNLKPEELLSKVSLEMKTEGLDSENKKSNEYHVKKLVKDMAKKGAEYGVLVSELEWDAENDPLIYKVQGEKSVYIVRPPYFVTFLSIVNALALKYRDITNQINHDKVEFQESIKIQEEFEKMKSEILDLSLSKLQKNLETLQNNNDKLLSLYESNRNALIAAINTHLNTVRNKINSFSIKKITSKIDDIE